MGQRKIGAGRKKVVHGQRPMTPTWCCYEIGTGDFSHWVKADTEEEALELAKKRGCDKVERAGD